MDKNEKMRKIILKAWGSATYSQSSDRMESEINAFEAGYRAALAAQPVSADAAPERRPELTLNGYQLKEALEFVAPDGDADQMESEVTIVYLDADEAPLDDDNKRMDAGLYAYSTDYPEEGCIPLTDEPPLISDAANNQSEREELYFLQDKRSYVGNCVSWWAKDGKGYTTRIDLAHRYTKAEAFAQHQCRETDIPWPCSVVEPLQRPTIDMQDLHKTGYFKTARADQEKARG